MNEWMNEWMNERTNERTKEGKNEWAKEHEAGICFIISGIFVVSTTEAATAVLHINKWSRRANRPMMAHDATVRQTQRLDTSVLRQAVCEE
jgi:hypothetical protein